MNQAHVPCVRKAFLLRRTPEDVHSERKTAVTYEAQIGYPRIPKSRVARHVAEVKRHRRSGRGALTAAAGERIYMLHTHVERMLGGRKTHVESRNS